LICLIIYQTEKLPEKLADPSGIRTHETRISWKVIYPLGYRGNHSGVGNSQSQMPKSKSLKIEVYFVANIRVTPQWLPR